MKIYLTKVCSCWVHSFAPSNWLPYAFFCKHSLCWLYFETFLFLLFYIEILYEILLCVLVILTITRTVRVSVVARGAPSMGSWSNDHCQRTVYSARDDAIRGQCFTSTNNSYSLNKPIPYIQCSGTSSPLFEKGELLLCSQMSTAIFYKITEMV